MSSISIGDGSLSGVITIVVGLTMYRNVGKTPKVTGVEQFVARETERVFKNESTPTSFSILESSGVRVDRPNS